MAVASKKILSRFFCLVIAVFATTSQPIDAQILGRTGAARSPIRPALTPGVLREGQFADGLSTFVIKDRRLSTATIKVLPQDEVWFLDGRQCHHCPENLSLISARKLVGQDWADDNLDNLVASHARDKSKTTFMYAHGNRTDEDWALARGLQFYQNVFGDYEDCRPPVRFVIWSWQAEQERIRPSRDYHEKSTRAVVVGKALGNMLSTFTDRDMVLAGFSLGSQAFLSALDQPQFQSQVDNSQSGQFQVALIAPALDGCYVSTQLNRYPVSTAIARTEIFDNGADRALRVSIFVRRKQAPDGEVSISQLAARGNLPLSNISLKDMAADIGKGHSVDRYTSEDSIRLALHEMTLSVASTTTWTAPVIE